MLSTAFPVLDTDVGAAKIRLQTAGIINPANGLEPQIIIGLPSESYSSQWVP